MTQTEAVYGYLRKNYADNEPILLSEISIPDLKDVLVRQQIKKLTEDGRLCRFDTGVYYFPKKTALFQKTQLSVDDVITKKYLMNGMGRCGYVTGILFANRLGLTTQVPAVYEICTNKATTGYRVTKLQDIKVVIRKPVAEICDGNADTLQFLDLLCEVSDISEIRGDGLSNRLIEYMKLKKIGFSSMEKYLSLYPDRIYRNMYEVKLLNGISAQK